MEEFGFFDVFEKVVVVVLLFDDIGSLVGEDMDFFVGFLFGNIVGGEFYEDGFGGYEGEFLVDVGVDDVWVEDNVVGNIV